MKITEEHIFKHDNDTTGYDIVIEASELGKGPGKPAETIRVEMPSGDEIDFTMCGITCDSNGTFMFWSYWNEEPGIAINLQVFND